MHEKTATLIGATGLIGSHLLHLLIRSSHYDNIRLITRKPFHTDNDKITVNQIDFSDQTAFREAISGSQVVFCAIGTTTRKVKGDEAAYRKVDFDIPVQAARFCAETACSKFMLVSSVGADPNSGSFYLRLKGETEQAIRSLPIRQIGIFRPSLLLGKRIEFRFGEVAGALILRPFSFLLPGQLKPVRAEWVARAMLQASLTDQPGVQVFTRSAIVRLVETDGI